MKRVKDARIYRSPPLWSGGNHFVLEFKALSPDRLDKLENLIFAPLEAIWRLLFAILIIDLCFLLFGGISLFDHPDLNRTPAYIGMGLFYITWEIDRWTRYSFWNYVFGQSVKITLSMDEVKFRRGWFTRFKQEREFEVAFDLIEVTGIGPSDAFKDAMRLSLVLDNKDRIPVAEIADRQIAIRTHANLSSALELLNERNEFDYDPTRKR